jgi:HK97 gp10 family phage protein
VKIKGEVKGIDKVLKNFQKFGEEGVKAFANDTKLNANDISAMAATNAPKNLGKLAQSIHDEKITPLRYRVNAGSNYAAYVEFGTGPKVKVPPEFQKMAAKFKGKGTGSFEQGLRSIQDWCRNKGIDVSAAYPIFMSILKNGNNPQPYLYPAFVKGRIQYFKDLKDSLKILTKKYG